MADLRGTGIGERLEGGAQGDRIRGMDGADELFGHGGNDRIVGGKGDDRIDGGAGDDDLVGGGGRDTFLFGAGHGNDVITHFRAGEDLLDLSALGITGLGEVAAAQTGGGLQLDLAAHGGGSILLKGFSGTLDAADFVFAPEPEPTPPEPEEEEEAGGGGAAPQLVTSPDQQIVTGPGDDHVRIVHNEGGSIVHGQRGDDILEGNGGNDILYGGSGGNLLYGHGGDDTLHAGGAGDVLWGGAGADTFVIGLRSFSIAVKDFESGDTVDLRAFGALGVDGFEDLEVSRHDGSGAAVVDIPGHYLAEVLLYGPGAGGIDASDFVFSNLVEGATAGNDELRGTRGHDFIEGGEGNDRLFGLRGKDILEGGAGHDRLFGYAGDDTLSGGAGDDWLWGGKGRDVIDGGSGDDWMRGNDGADIFVFSRAVGDDAIDDFTDGEDLVDLQAYGPYGLAFADIGAAAVQDGGDVRIDLSAAVGRPGLGTITLRDFELADLDAGDFLF